MFSKRAACPDKTLTDEGASFVVLLRTSAKKKDLYTGTKVHDYVLKKGLLKVYVSEIATMYAKCGSVGKAHELLSLHASRDVVAWTALIAGYVQKGQSQKALNCFKQMEHEGISPDAVTYACILKACGSITALDAGEQIHDEIAKKRLLGSNIVLGNALVDMYAKCGSLVKAKQVLEELPTRDVVSWSALIAGYAQEGQAEQALKCFECLQHEGLTPNAVTFLSILRVYGSIGAVVKAEQIHYEIARRMLVESNILLGYTLVDAYAKCGALMKARWVLDELPFRDVVSWNVVISKYVEEGQGAEALECFEEMQSEGISPDEVTFLSTLKACGSIRAVEQGEQIHEKIVRQGLLDSNIVLSTALVDMYAKCGALAKAQRVLECFPIRDVFIWSALIAGYAEEGQGHNALNCFDRMQQECLYPDPVTYLCILKACGSLRDASKGDEIHFEIASQGLLGNDIMLSNALVDMYAKCGALEEAQQVVDKLPVRDVVTWNALISGYAQEDQGEQALECFERMQWEALSPDVLTYSSILKACGSIGAANKGEKIHDEIARCGLLGKNMVLGNALVDMYAKCGALAKAQEVMEELPIRDVFSWSSLMVAYAEQGLSEQALDCALRMKDEGLSPNAAIFSCILKACGIIGAADRGECVYDEVARWGWLQENVMLGNAVVDMFAKCGTLAKAYQALEELPVRDHLSWNAVISGCAQKGQGDQALRCFERMQREGMFPDSMTFSCMLKHVAA